MTTTTTVKLPPPRANAPILTRMMSDAVEQGSAPIVWLLAREHPLASGWQIRRMFVDNGGVEVYAISPDGTHGLRNLIPMSRVRMIEEAMSLDVFIYELEVAESDDDDDDSEPELEPEPEASVVASNGQAVT